MHLCQRSTLSCNTGGGEGWCDHVPGWLSGHRPEVSVSLVVNRAMIGPRRLGLPLFAAVISVLVLMIGYGPASTETRAYRPFLIFGQEGREVGLFRQPTSVLVDPAGRLYVADTYNHRVQVFEPDGRFRQVLGVEGAQQGALSRPKRLAWGPRGLYVADTGNHRVQVFDAQGDVVFVLGGFGNSPAQFNAPEGIAVDTHGTLYVADTQNHRVQKFAPEGRFLLSWGGSGSGKGEFLEPSDIVLDRGERLLIADAQNHRVQMFTTDGRYLGEIGRAGRGAGEFDTPRGVATDGEGHLYVADTGNGRVQIFDRMGRYLAQVGHLGKQPSEFYYPTGVWIDAQRTLYVADTINHRIQILTYFPALAALEEGWEALKATRLDAALDKWREALNVDPTLAEALYGSGLAYARQGSADLAIEQLRAALALQPDYSEARWALYRAYVGKLLLPLIALGLIAAFSSGTLVVRRLRRRVLRERARHLLEEGRIQETIVAYERLLSLDRNAVEVCKALETLYEQEGLENKRKQLNELIVRLEPDNLPALSYLGKQQFAERRMAEAQQTWERVLQQDPTWAEGHFYLGAVLAERGEVEPALSAYQRALSQSMQTQGNSSERPSPDTTSGVEPRLIAVIELWERELAAGSQHGPALARFQEARHRLAQEYVTRGREHLQRDDAEGAIPPLRWGNALQPMDDSARTLLRQAQTSLTFDRGLHCYEAQEYIDALRCFRETLAIDPDHEKAKRYLRYAQQCLEGGLSERFRHLDLGGDREKF